MIFVVLQFLRTAVSEAKDVNCDIQNSLSEQRQLLAFSAQQQEEVHTFLLSYLHKLHYMIII